jgi:FkbM family methyltransferase
MPLSKTVPEPGLGFRVVDIPSPFDIRRHGKPSRGALVAGEPLTIRSDRKPWSGVVGFPSAEHAFVPPRGANVFCWAVGIEARLVSGAAVLAHASADGKRILDQVALDLGAREFHVLLDAPVDGAQILVRHGAVPGPTELQISGFRCVGLIDDAREPLRPPTGLELSPIARWSRFYGDAFDDLGERVRFLRFRTLAAPRLMTWLDGLELLLVPGDEVSRAVYVSGLYEPSTVSVLRKVLHDGATFIDVGANVGLFSMLASRWVGPRGTVLALEPSRRECARLRHHLDHNSLDNVRVLQVAAGKERGSAVLHVADTGHAGQNTLEPQFVYPGVHEAYTELVSVVDIDDVVREQGLDRVHVIKVDVEGGEHNVLAGARQTIARDLPILLVEVTGAGPGPGHSAKTEIEALLGSLGYCFLAIDGETGKLRRTTDLTGPSENFLAARPEVIATLGV